MIPPRGLITYVSIVFPALAVGILVIGALLGGVALAVAFMVGTISVGAFLGSVIPVLRGYSEDRVRRYALLGGAVGWVFAVGIIIADWIAR